jgi:hypothetical protein
MANEGLGILAISLDWQMIGIIFVQCFDTLLTNYRRKQESTLGAFANNPQ